jgi:hypothetical protein
VTAMGWHMASIASGLLLETALNGGSKSPAQSMVLSGPKYF